MSTPVGTLCVLTVAVLSMTTMAAPPGLKSDGKGESSLPAWFAFHRELVKDLRSNQKLGPLLAPGVNFEAAGADVGAAPLRVPIFLVMLQDTQDRDKLVAHARAALFGPRGLQLFLNQLMVGMRTFLDPNDLVPVVIGGEWNDYLNGSKPRRHLDGSWPLFDNISASLRADGRALVKNHYIARSNGERLSKGRGTQDPGEDTVDGCILILACCPNTVYAYRWWMGEELLQAGPQKLPEIQSANGDRFKIDSFIAMSAYAHLPSLHLSQTELFYPGFLHHEFLHLFRVPDLYDRRGDSGEISQGCGCWCSMSWGMFGARDTEEAFPVWPGAWVRRMLNPRGEVVVSSSKANQQLTSVALNHALAEKGGRKFAKLPIQQSPRERYLLVELRGKAGPDEKLVWDEPDCRRSFLVWDVDENVGHLNQDGQINLAWPTGAIGMQNDSDDAPLVALCPRAYSKQTVAGPVIRRNLRPADEVRNFSDLGTWSENDNALVHPSGWVLSHWNPATGEFFVRYNGSVSAPPELLSSGGVSEPAPQSAPNVAGSVSARQTLMATGTAEEVSRLLPDAVNQRLRRLYEYFPRQQRITVDQGGAVEFTTMVSHNASKAGRSLLEQFNLLSSIFGNGVTEVKMRTDKTPSLSTGGDLLQSLREKGETVLADAYLDVGGRQLRVYGAPVIVEQEPDPLKPSDPNSFRFYVPQEVKLPQLKAAVEAIRSGHYSREADVLAYLRKIKLSIPSDASLELVIENNTGQLFWRCTFSYADSSRRMLMVPALEKLGPDTVLKVE